MSIIHSIQISTTMTIKMRELGMTRKMFYRGIQKVSKLPTSMPMTGPPISKLPISMPIPEICPMPWPATHICTPQYHSTPNRPPAAQESRASLIPTLPPNPKTQTDAHTNPPPQPTPHLPTSSSAHHPQPGPKTLKSHAVRSAQSHPDPSPGPNPDPSARPCQSSKKP